MLMATWLLKYSEVIIMTGILQALKPKIIKKSSKSKKHNSRVMQRTIFSFTKSNKQKQPPQVLCRKGVLRNFAKFTGKELCQSLFSLLKKRLWHRCLHVNFAKFLKAPFFKKIWRTPPVAASEQSFFKRKYYVIFIIFLLWVFEPFLCKRGKQRCIQNPGKHLRWSVLRKTLHRRYLTKFWIRLWKRTKTELKFSRITLQS